jgi:CheY-like chemotaxis protein
MHDPPVLLVVEDDASIRALLAAVGLRAGFRSHAVDGGEQALLVLRNESPDVILLDLLMPGTDGFDVLHYLDTTSPAMLKRVIVVTAASAAELVDCEELRRVWCVRRKPLDIGDLMSEMLGCAEAVKDVAH